MSIELAGRQGQLDSCPFDRHMTSDGGRQEGGHKGPRVFRVDRISHPLSRQIMTAHAHEPLDAFLGAWLHQDCCMNGETLQDIVFEYRSVARDEDKRALRVDIERFLNEAAGDVDARLEKEFDLDIIPSAFAAGGEDFLRTIHRLLESS
jgi:hypothetical protein